MEYEQLSCHGLHDIRVCVEKGTAVSFFPSYCQQEASPSDLVGSPGFMGDALADTQDLSGSAACLPHTAAAPF